MKKYFWLIFSMLLLLGTSVYATYDDFSNQLKIMGIDVGKITSQDSISRYDVARLLNSVECKDCITPNQTTINRYTQNFRSGFITTPGKDFGDITYLGGIYNNYSYYYCVAYVGDNTYMRGYPKATSPVCGGQFCGMKETTTADFIQVVINILAKYIYKDLTLSRKQVNTWIAWLKTDSYERRNFTTDDITAITAKAKTCENICGLQDASEVNLYLKYCMFNLAKCSMQEIGKIKQWYRPVAELNLLYRQHIIDIDQTLRRNTDKNIDGKSVLETLFKINGKVNCAFNNDYDCDSVKNTKDNCPNVYNPNQKDTDKDGIGDVCDDDIDGDGIKNPVGIVDDEGNVDIAKRTKDMDNCLFVVNTGQDDTDKDRIGDACENMTDQIGIYISIDQIQWNAPLTIRFNAMTSGEIKDVTWDFGDGTQGRGTSIAHTFVTPNMYTVQATAKGTNTDGKAQVIIIVWGQRGDERALQTRTSMVWGDIGTESTLSTMTMGGFDEIDRIFPRENITSKKKPSESFKRVFKNSGENEVLVKWYSKWALAGISYFTIGIGWWRGAILRSNETTMDVYKKMLFDTRTYNIRQEDIVKVDRDFWEDTILSNTSLTMEHAFSKPGKRIITQTITLIDGKKLINMITISISDPSTLWSYALLMKPSSLIADVGDKIDFSTRVIGSMAKIPLIQIANFGDGTTEKKNGTEQMPSVFVHAYQKNGILTPYDTLAINQCAYLKNQATISIKGIDICLDAKNKNELKRFKCDLDGDGIPDICDTDIDGDGIPNLLGLITAENKDCSYESDPGKKNANLDQDILAKQYQGVCSLDNAPFTNNPDQLDLNQDGIGDNQGQSLPIGNGKALDADGDGIPDTQDLCPYVQETWNGISDEDGCPEVGLEFWCDQQGIIPLIGITNDTIIINPIENTWSLPTCGNGVIDAGEDCKNCPQDVGICTSYCGDGIVSPGENCINCPADIPSCGICGNGIKDPNESCKTCPQDYGTCTPQCGNGVIDPGELCTNCPQDVRLCIDIPNLWICNQCPCQFADYASDLTDNDQVRAILRDKKKTIQYKFSQPRIVDFTTINKE